VIGFRYIAALAVLPMACCLGAGAAAQTGSDVTQLTSTLPTLNPGQTAWVSTLWQGACSDATSFKMLASGPPGITISYPTNTATYSSLYKQSTLLADDTDYASLKITVGDNVIGDQTIALTVSYDLTAGSNGSGTGSGGTDNGIGNGGTNNGHHNGTSGCDAVATSVTRQLQVTLPVVAFSGPAVQLVTTSVGPITAGTAAWVNISYKANGPGVTGARLTATPPAGATVTYPNNGTSSGLAANADLAVGQTDYASFKIDTGSLKPGSYTVGVDLAYGNGSHQPGSVTLVVGIFVIGAMASAASGCGPTKRTSVSGSGSGLDPQIVAAYVDAQAHALCLVQSKAYPTQAALHDAYIAAEHSTNLPPDQFAQASAAVAHNAALRTQISERVVALCGKHPAQATSSK
jgi:hypothetical protein